MERLFGMPVWEFFSQNPEQSESFNKAMTNLSSMESPVVVRAYDFSGLGTICDVGGGHGLLLSSVLNANPRLRGTLYDLPQVAEGARSGPLEALEGRASILSGDMFESVPAGFDAYMMKYIIHDWNDEYSRKLLANCRKGVNPGGKLLVVDQVVPPGNQFAPSKIMDLTMLLFIDGLERTETQFRNLFASAGWRMTRIIPTESPLCIVEGEPA
jgi:SAM-dependent methyltransferase